MIWGFLILVLAVGVLVHAWRVSGPYAAVFLVLFWTVAIGGGYVLSVLF